MGSALGRSFDAARRAVSCYGLAVADDTTNGPLAGFRVINLSSTLLGLFAGQVLADFGAETILVEPPGGHPYRAQPGWPVLSRGSCSNAAGVHRESDVEVIRNLAGRADVVIETWRPGVAERLGLGYEQLREGNPRLVYGSATGFGRDNPLSQIKGYEAVVLAKVGGLDQFSTIVDRDGPGFPTVPNATWSAAHTLLQGVLACLVERERSGLGQRVDTTMVQALGAHDVMGWMIRFMALQYPDAFTQVPFVDPKTRVPNSWMGYALMVGLSKDGRWMQFSQATMKLFRAFLRSVDLDGPEWDDAWDDEDLGRRSAFRDRALEAIRSKTYDEWLEYFDANPDVFAEVFRKDHELMEHPQLLHDGSIIEVDEPGIGPIRQPGPMVQMEGTPGVARPSPALDADGDRLRAEGAERPPAVAAPAAPKTATAPLEGINILELGTFYAGPYGASILSDLGARILKIEQSDGDPIRWQLPTMPEIGAIKALLGKQSVGIDINTPEGQELVKDIARQCQQVLHTFRSGVATRVGLDEPALREVRPDIVYHSGVGFGTSGPYAHRPAYAPTIGAGSGMARRNIGGAVPERTSLTLDQVKDGATTLSAASMTLAHPDGFSAVGVATGMLLGLVAQARGLGGQATQTSMLATVANLLSEDLFEYPDRNPAMTADPGLHGFGPLYRLYETADGWVFLAVTTDREWNAFISVAGDVERDAEALSALFLTRSAADWEKLASGVDVACVEVVKGAYHIVFMDDDGMGRQLGFVTDVSHPLFETHPRLTAYCNFSRSTTVALPAPIIGEHTDAVLTGLLGLSDERIAELKERGVVYSA